MTTGDPQSELAFAEAPDLPADALKACGFEHLEKRLWHKPGGIAAEITVHGRIKLTLVKDGLSMQAGTFTPQEFQDAFLLLLSTFTRLVNRRQT